MWMGLRSQARQDRAAARLVSASRHADIAWDRQTLPVEREQAFLLVLLIHNLFQLTNQLYRLQEHDL
jgi:hypothetical protein